MRAGVSPATVSRVLKRAGLSRMKDLEPAEPVRRNEYADPRDSHQRRICPGRFESEVNAAGISSEQLRRKDRRDERMAATDLCLSAPFFGDKAHVVRHQRFWAIVSDQ